MQSSVFTFLLILTNHCVVIWIKSPSTFSSHPNLYYLLSESSWSLLPFWSHPNLYTFYQVILILYLLFELYPDSLFTLNLSNFLYLLDVLSIEVASRFPCFDDAKLRLFAYTTKSFIAFLTLSRLIFDVNQSVVCVHTTKLRFIWHTSKIQFDIHQSPCLIYIKGIHKKNVALLNPKVWTYKNQKGYILPSTTEFSELANVHLHYYIYSKRDIVDYS